MNAWQFADTHPWWTLIYLAIIASAFSGIIKLKVKRRCQGPCCKTSK